MTHDVVPLVVAANDVLVASLLNSYHVTALGMELLHQERLSCDACSRARSCSTRLLKRKNVRPGNSEVDGNRMALGCLFLCRWINCGNEGGIMLKVVRKWRKPSLMQGVYGLEACICSKYHIHCRSRTTLCPRPPKVAVVSVSWMLRSMFGKRISKLVPRITCMCLNMEPMKM